MGVYIKGMEMPAKGEYHMTLYVCDDGYAYMDVDLFPVDSDRFEAVPVPPHGRTIDKDVMCNECRRIAEEYDGIYPDCTYCPAHLAPTIIPAEEGE
jgi:hypothetical protein